MSTYHIDAMSFGGRGIARKDGKIFFISGAIVGDEVEIEITKNKKRFAEATVTKLVKSSKESVEAPCPIARRMWWLPMAASSLPVTAGLEKKASFETLLKKLLRFQKRNSRNTNDPFTRDIPISQSH